MDAAATLELNEGRQVLFPISLNGVALTGAARLHSRGGPKTLPSDEGEYQHPRWAKTDERSGPGRMSERKPRSVRHDPRMEVLRR